MGWASKAEEHRERAARVRAWLRDMQDDDNRKMALSVADAYETLAKAEEAIAFGPRNIDLARAFRTVRPES